MILSPKEWLYSSICFVVGLLMLYDYSINDSIQSYIMIPITLLGGISFFLFLKSISQPEDKINEHFIN